MVFYFTNGFPCCQLCRFHVMRVSLFVFSPRFVYTHFFLRALSGFIFSLWAALASSIWVPSLHIIFVVFLAHFDLSPKVFFHCASLR